MISRLTVAVAVVLVAAPATAIAAPAWDAPVTIAGSDGAEALRLGADGAGGRIAAWTATPADPDAPATAVAATAAPGAAFSPGAVVSDVAYPPDTVALATPDPGGATALAWVGTPADTNLDSRIDFTTGSTAGLGPRRSVPAATAGDGPSEVAAATTADGSTILAWVFSNATGRQQVATATVAPDGTLGPRQTLGSPGYDASSVRVEATGDGRAVIAWLAADDNAAGAATVTTQRVQVARRTGAAFSDPGAGSVEQVQNTTVDGSTSSRTTGTELGPPQLGLDDAGGLTLGYVRTTIAQRTTPDPAPGDSESATAVLATGSVASGLGAPTTISGADDVSALVVAAAPDGGGVAAYASRAGAIRAAVKPADGAFGAPADVETGISPPVEDGDLAAAARTGGPTVAWIAGDRVRAATATGTAFAPAVAVAPDDSVSAQPALAADAHGAAFAIWQLDPNAVADGNETVRTSSLADRSAPQPQPQPQPQPAPQPPPPPSAPPADTEAPVISGLAITPSRFRLGSAASPFTAAALRRGARITFTLSEPAYVRATVSRLRTAPGGRRRCDGPARPHGRTLGRVAILERTFAGGPERVAFSGRVGRRALARGRYVLRLRAADRAGNLSAIRSVPFTLC